MTNPPVTSDVLQSGDVLLHLSTQLSLDHVGILDVSGDPAHLILTEISRLDLRSDSGSLTDVHRNLVSDPVDVSQRHVDALIPRDVYTLDPRHEFDPTLYYSLASSTVKSPVPPEKVLYLPCLCL